MEYSSCCALTNNFDTFNDVDIVVNHLMMLFEDFNELIEWRKRFDVFVRIDVSYFGVFTKLTSSEMSLNYLGNLGMFHVLLYVEGLDCDGYQ